MPHQHLTNSNETYASHSKWAVVAGLQLIWAGIASILHALHPSLFPFTAAKVVIDLYYKRLHNHVNADYRRYIETNYLHKKDKNP
jgi:hypothetical protein